MNYINEKEFNKMAQTESVSEHFSSACQSKPQRSNSLPWKGHQSICFFGREVTTSPHKLLLPNSI